MKPASRVFIIFLLLCSSLAAQSAPPSLPGIPVQMHWRNAPASWNLSRGALTIKSAAATDWFVSPIDGHRAENAPVLLFPAAKDFSLSARVTVDFHAQWDAGLLAIYANDATWVKVCLETGLDRRPSIVTVVTRGLSDDSTSVPIDANSVFLKIAKSGQAIFLYYSRDGQKWNPVRSFSLGQSGDLQVGFSSQSPSGTGVSATFSEIQYKPQRVANLFAGN